MTTYFFLSCFLSSSFLSVSLSLALSFPLPCLPLPLSFVLSAGWRSWGDGLLRLHDPLPRLPCRGAPSSGPPP